MRLIMPCKNKEDARAYDKAYYEANKKKKLASNKAWKAANRERRLATQKVYREANKEDTKAYDKDYYEANKKKRAASMKAWKAANVDRTTYYVSRRKALKLKLIPKHLKNCPVEKQRVLDIYKLRILISKATGIEHHVDHMWPLSDGGPHWSGNLQIITAHENQTKHASVDLEVKHNIQQSLKETM